ncbi:YnfU family zinc-binding protein [Hafnia alvei]|uniref:YnfU family zinc-binding protein n=1 Tax=Hafnia alvei TaxID=569 RepID=UPI0036F35CBA
MSYLKGIKSLISRTVSVSCPHCSQLTQQSTAKLRKDSVLVCSCCGTLFKISECNHV